MGIGLPANSAASWYWVAALAANIVVRLFLPATTRWRVASALLDALLWSALVASIDPLPAMLATRLGGALAGSVLIAALSTPARGAPVGLALAWILPIVTMGVHAASGSMVALGLVLWVASVMWLGATRPSVVAPAREPKTQPRMPPANAGSTRRGVQLAVQASAEPMIALHNGRVFEINTPAAAALGLITFDWIGRRVGELAAFEPPDALEQAKGSRSGSIEARMRTVTRGRAEPLDVRIRSGYSASGDLITIIAAEVPRPVAEPPVAPAATVIVPAPEPAAPELRLPEVLPVPLLPAHPDVLRNLPVLAWVVDGEGRVVHAHVEETRRWGMKIGPALRPRWWDAFVFQARSRDAFLKALQSAVGGRPTYDLLIERASPSGGRLALRSHIVPVAWPDDSGAERPSALVLDTVASAHELLEVDRLRRRKQHYKSLVEASPNLIWSCDAGFRFTFVSRRACQDLYAYEVADLIGVSIGVLLDPGADQTSARRALVALREGHAMRDFEMGHVTKDGRHLIVAVSAVALADSQGQFAGAVGMMVDLTALKQREASLAEALRMERSVLDSAGQALAVIRDGAVARCNDAFLQLLRRTAAELRSVRVVDVFSDRGEWAAAMAAADRAALADQAVVREIKLQRAQPDSRDEMSVWCQLTLRSVEKGEYVLALADIDSIRRREAHALFDARHDELTGLANRRLFSERARAALATSALRNSGCAIVVVDLDGFKLVNDRHGHACGDEVLQEMARRLQRVVRPQDTVARYGGDEFAILIPDAGSRRDVEAITQRVLLELARPVRVANSAEEALSASVGVALASDQSRDPIELLGQADRAMYEAKTSGGNRAVFAPAAETMVDFAAVQAPLPAARAGRAA